MTGRRARVTSDISKDIPEPGEYWIANTGTSKVRITQVLGDKTHYTPHPGDYDPGAMPTRMFRYYYSKVVDK